MAGIGPFPDPVKTASSCHGEGHRRQSHPAQPEDLTAIHLSNWFSLLSGLLLGFHSSNYVACRNFLFVCLAVVISTTHPLRGDEIRAIKAWLVERSRMKARGRSFYLSEQRKPLHRSTVNLALRQYGEKAELPVAVHPHMLRHACGFALDSGTFSTPCATSYGPGAV